MALAAAAATVLVMTAAAVTTYLWLPDHPLVHILVIAFNTGLVVIAVWLWPVWYARRIIGRRT